MKLTPFHLYLNSLRSGPRRLGYLEKDEALRCLRRLTGEDFGYDIERWRAWGKMHPEISDGSAYRHRTPTIKPSAETPDAASDSN